MIIQTMVALMLNEPTISQYLAERVHPVQAPDAPSYPMAVVHKVSGFGVYDLQGDAGLEDGRVQIDIYDDEGQAHLLLVKTAVRRFFSGFKGGEQVGRPCAIDSCMCINDFDLNEPSTERAGPRIKRRVLEFRVWNTEI